MWNSSAMWMICKVDRYIMTERASGRSAKRQKAFGNWKVYNNISTFSCNDAFFTASAEIHTYEHSSNDPINKTKHNPFYPIQPAKFNTYSRIEFHWRGGTLWNAWNYKRCYTCIILRRVPNFFANFRRGLAFGDVWFVMPVSESSLGVRNLIFLAKLLRWSQPI